MERNDSSAAMSSLAMYGRADEENSDDDQDKLNSPSISAIDNISDEETELPSSRPSSRTVLDEDYNSGSSATLPDKELTKKPLKRKPTRLVSYGKDDLESDEEEKSDEEEGEQDDLMSNEHVLNSSLNPEQASLLSRSVLNKAADEIEIPPEPTGKCSRHLQEKIAKLYEKMRRDGLNMVASIERRKDFRNPSICEKLIEYCGIDEKGTNYPPEIFDPHRWGKESFYDALDKAQTIEVNKREKEKKDKTKIEFVVGTKKISSEGPSDEKRRKSKWDAQPSVINIPGMINPAVINLTATGTKSTVIPAHGSITKKSSK
ncbi:SAP30-binding protein [Mizuhopecten yessoensis]|uniref:SAP30-binding protein n=2 Tax=Mizuhopecten yessoensis TaxID=6573 RepID=A0A210QP72_MIZYE|nr:SAP30-binding protein [Mizuhopecten yessoensis]